MKSTHKKLKINVIAFTINGACTASKLRNIFFNWQSIEAVFFVTNRIMNKISESNLKSMNFTGITLEEFTSKSFEKADHVIYIGAAGIAVRAISLHLKSKDLDPGVIVIDERAKHIIPILSGHIGGSNQLAKEIAKELGSEPVITTATDINDVISIDSWAVDNYMKIDSIKNIKHISSAVLENTRVKVYNHCRGTFAQIKTQELLNLYSGFELVDSLESYQFENKYPLVVITDSIDIVEKVKNRFPCALVLIPSVVFVGMGCRKDIDSSLVDQLFKKSLEELDIDIRAISSINTVDIKKQEKGLLILSQNHGLLFNTFSAEELLEAENQTSSEISYSELVSRTVGIGNVCEAAAVMGAFNSQVYSELMCKNKNINKDKKYIEIIMKKTKLSGVTMAVSCI